MNIEDKSDVEIIHLGRQYNPDKDVNHDRVVSYETAKLLKQAGFDWDCYGAYDTNLRTERLIWCLGYGTNWNNTRDENLMIDGLRVGEEIDLIPASAPSLNVAQRWLRETKGCEVYVLPRPGNGYEVAVMEYYSNYRNHSITYRADKFDTYEDALETGIRCYLDRLLNGYALRDKDVNKYIHEYEQDKPKKNKPTETDGGVSKSNTEGQ